MAETVGGALGGIGMGAGLGLGLGVLSDQARLTLLWAKWHGRGRQWKQDMISATLNNLLISEKDEASGLSSKGAVDAIVNFIDGAIDLAMQVDETLGMQLFVQMIQQSIAYAIHTSHAGSIGTMANIYSGSMYLSGTQAESVGHNVDFFDRNLNALISAEMGLNKPTLTFELVRGANARTEEIFRAMLSDMDKWLSEWNDLSMSYYRQYHTMARERFGDAVKMKETAVDRAYALLEQISNEHMARISEQLDTLDGAKQWFDSGLMSLDELNNIALTVDLERIASEVNYNELKTETLNAITSAIGTWDTKINTALSDMTNVETKYSILIKKIFDEQFAKVASFVEQLIGMVSNAVDDTNAYRNSVRALEITHSGTIIPQEMYELEVYVENMAQIS